MSDVAISVENISKCYRIGTQGGPGYHRLSEMITGVPRALWNAGKSLVHQRSPAASTAPEMQNNGEFWALKDVSFEIKQGEVVGIIGRNGAGKSTLLKILSRITEPTSGRFGIRGRVASLLEVGTGFHPELTGRENIHVSGITLGMTRAEIKKRFDEIVEFSGVEKFLDTPVKHYSSGMQVRLGFAVAAHLESEILIVDEVLTVGDAAFQKKCVGRMQDVAHDGRTVLLVSHNLAMVRQLASTALLLESGEVLAVGNIDSVSYRYRELTIPRDFFGRKILAIDPAKVAQVTSVELVGADGQLRTGFSCDESFALRLRLRQNQQIDGIYGYLQVSTDDGLTVLVSDSQDLPTSSIAGLEPGTYQISISFPSRLLGHGTYDVYLNLASISADHFQVDCPGVIARLTISDDSTIRANSRLGLFSTLLAWEVSPNMAHEASNVEF